MRRLERAILELESFRRAVNEQPWHGPSEFVLIGLLNSAIAAISQAKAVTPVSMRRGHTNARVDEMIGQINEETRSKSGE